MRRGAAAPCRSGSGVIGAAKTVYQHHADFAGGRSGVPRDTGAQENGPIPEWERARLSTRSCCTTGPADGLLLPELEVAKAGALFAALEAAAQAALLGTDGAFLFALLLFRGPLGAL